MASRRAIMVVDWGLLRAALGLPLDCKIVDISHHVRFCFGQVALMIESSIFPETQDGCLLPEVTGRYQIDEANKHQFVGWEGLPSSPC